MEATVSRKARKAGPEITDEQLKHAASVSGRRSATYVFPDRTVVTIQAVASPLIYDLQSDTGKPAPPLKEVRMAGGVTAKLPDESDPEYKQKVLAWEVGKAAKYSRIMISEGVRDWPPEDVVQLWVNRGVTNPEEIKFHWIASKLVNPKLESDFYEAVTGLSMATEDGLQDAEDRFPSVVPPNGSKASPGESVDAEAEETRNEGRKVSDKPADGAPAGS